MWLIKGAYISYWAAYIYYFYTYEKILKKKIHLAPILCVAIISLIILLPYELAIYELFAYTFTIMGLYYLHTLFTLMKRSLKELRAATSFIILGTFFIGFFIIYINPVVMRLENTPILIFPILCIFGIFLCMAPTVFNPEFFARDIKYWYLFILTLIVCVLFSTIYNVIVVKTIEYVLGSFIYLIFYFLECFFLIRWIKREKSQDSQTNIGIRGVFTKPEKMTEEEVSISKEKKICLVCKNKVARFNIYICPECDTLYCENCARTLSNLENLCWVCDTPFDESKPVKFFKKVKEMEEIEISEKPQNKLNNAKKL